MTVLLALMLAAAVVAAIGLSEMREEPTPAEA